MGEGEKFVGHCHSVMHEFAAHAHTETTQIFKLSEGGGTEAGGGGYSRAPPPLYETLPILGTDSYVLLFQVFYCTHTQTKYCNPSES